MKSKRTRLRMLRTSQKILQCPQIETPGVTAMALFDDGIGRGREEAVDIVRSGHRFRLRAAVAPELGPDASEGGKRSVFIEREPDDVLFLVSGFGSGAYS